MSIAVIGMSGRFPGAANVARFWQNLRSGTESIRFFDDEELLAAGVPAGELADPHYVKAASFPGGYQEFDATLFGYSAREAQLIDPQQRMFLECCWEAFEDAGYAPGRVDCPVGVYAGSSLSTYLIEHVLAGRSIGSASQTLDLLVSNDKDYLASRVAYQLNLTGPAVAVQTACSSSLVAVHMACQALLTGECDLAVAGGSSLRLPQPRGYRWEEGLIFSADGHCRPFDAAGGGTVFGSGVGVVVLKRLGDALADRDLVHAVIKGSAANNDGRAKIGYTAPGVEGQAAVIAAALGAADVDPGTVTAVEAHGTATPVGDPIEVAALTRVFSAYTARTGYCALGSVKSNVGHLDSASGVTGLIKAILQAKHGELVPSLHFQRPNPQIDFASTPFQVSTCLRPWETGGLPRRIGVSSFGMGGTNAHVVVEEPPATVPAAPGEPERDLTVLTLSAATPAALDAASAALAEVLSQPDPPGLADVAHTLRVARAQLPKRRAVVAASAAAAAAVLAADGQAGNGQAGNGQAGNGQAGNGHRQATAITGSARASGPPRQVWLFPGQGSQYPGMGSQLYASEPVLRDCVDECLSLLDAGLSDRLRRVLLQPGEDAAEALQQTELAQPALFVVEYALARLLLSWGLAPEAAAGHSVGEYVAATLAGVFTLPDALRVIAARGRLMQRMAPGAMLAVALPEADLLPKLPGEVGVAAVNAPGMTVVAGPVAAVDALAAELSGQANCRKLRTSHAFHTAMMEPMLAEFTAELAGVPRGEPTLPYLSNRTGSWITAEQATDPGYWAAHAREPVRFADSLATLAQWAGENGLAVAEVGPGRALASLTRQNAPRAVMAPLLPATAAGAGEQASVLTGLARLWAAGAAIEPPNGTGSRVPLPTYQFDRRRYWIDGGAERAAATLPAAVAAEGGEDGNYGERPPLESEYLAPRDEREEVLAAIWQDLLGVRPVGVRDNFIELGGHSLLATRMVEQVRARFGVRLPLRRVLASPTIAGLAEMIVELSAGQRQDEVPQAVPDPAALHEPFPLTEIQQAQWLGRLASFAGGNIAAHVYWEVEGTGIDLPRLERAWQRVMDRHPMLRAVLTADGRQRILPDTPPYRIAVTDLRQSGDDERERQLAALTERLSHEVRPADSWPLFEIRAVLLPGERTRVCLSFDLLISDIGSIRLLLRDWSACYRDPQAALPPLGLSFRDYVLALARLRESPLYERSLAYWRERIRELPPRPDLPLAVSPAAVETPEFTARDHVVDDECWQRLRSRAAKRGLTESAVMLAAYAAALGAWSRTGRFTLNVTVINRLPVHPDVGGLAGEFASFDLLPADLTVPGGFAELAARLQRQSWQDLEYRYINGVEVLREMARAEGGATGAVMPLVFTSTLVADHQPGESMFGWLGDVVHEIAQTPQVWIDCALLPVSGGVQLSWHAVRQLFSDDVLDPMFGAFRDLVHALAGGDEWWEGSLPSLLPASHQAMVTEVNDTRGPCPDGTLTGPVVAAALASPQRTAVIDAGGQLSYGELYARACELAWALREAGTGAGDLVAVSVPKSREQVVAVLAVLLAGGAYLPVDPGLPVARRNHLLAVTSAKTVLTAGEGCANGPGDGRGGGSRDGRGERGDWPEPVRAIAVDLAAEPRPRTQAGPPQADVSPDALAYVIFTSGSTGEPKGVMISHRAALNTVTDISARYQVGPGDRVLGLSSLSFDLSVYDIFGVLGAGGTLVLPRPGTSRDPGHWLELIEQHGVTLWNSVPALAQMLADHALGSQLAATAASGAQDAVTAGGGHPAVTANGGHPATTAGGGHPALGTLRLVLMSGDWIPLDLPDRLRTVAPRAHLVSLGGATEAAIWSIAYDIGEVDPAWQSVPYGRPLRNQTMHVLNDRLAECPLWVTGELYIGGLGVAAGYWADGERTSASFITHPVTGERLYRTGDLGRWRPDGLIEFLGREDSQVKIGGFRIELGEIDAVLARQPGVAAAVAAAVGPDRHHRRLVGYLVPAGEQARTPEADEALIAAVRQAAEDTLPSYMVPGSFCVLGTLPLSANGKVDRAALPDPAASGSGPAADAGPVAAALAQIVAEIVGVPSAGADDNFFALGGDSITGIQVVNRAAADGLPVKPEDLFRQPTIRALASVVAGRLGSDGPASAGAEPTPHQRLLLSASDGARKAAHWAHLRVPPGLAAEQAAEVVNRLVERHPALRQRLAGTALRTGDPGPAYVPLIDLGALPADRRAAALAAMTQEMCGELDPAAGPVLQAALFGLGGERRLCLTALDFACDAKSWPVLLGAFTGGPPDTAASPDAGASPDARDHPDATDHPDAGEDAGPVPLASAELLAAAAERYRLAPAELAAVAVAEALRLLGAAGDASLAVEYDLREIAAGAQQVGPWSVTGPLPLPASTGDLAHLIPLVKEAYRAQVERAAAGAAGRADSAVPGARILLRHLGEMPPGVRLDGTVQPAAAESRMVEVTSWLASGGLAFAVSGDAAAGGDAAGGDAAAGGDTTGAASPAALAGALATACQRLAEHCRQPGTGSVSPSDFPLADLSQEELDAFLAEAVRGVEEA